MDLIPDICRHGEREYRLLDERTLASYKTKSEFHVERKDSLNALRIDEEMTQTLQEQLSTSQFHGHDSAVSSRGACITEVGGIERGEGNL
ncbi:hypothetical protein N7G274_001896 [Stereocaulon virgatum]|uniref:Uncharacterized protein n=1 Tax=Stereocaulon virgatum TaxID=373712 RepID=A0ABR4ALQ2_9LECA